MPVLNCPSGPAAGPVKTETDGAHGLSIISALRNARRDAFNEADDEVVDEIDDNYECRVGCELVMGPPVRVGVYRYPQPPRRAWWTLGIAYWAVATASVTRSVSCVPKSEGEAD